MLPSVRFVHLSTETGANLLYQSVTGLNAF